MLPFHSDGKNSCVIKGSSFNVSSILQARLIACGQDTKERRQSSSLPWILVVMTQKNSIPSNRSREGCTGRLKMEGFPARSLLDQSGQGTRERSTILARSHATIFHDSVPADWIEKVVSLQGVKILYRRIPTLRPAPKVVLKGDWQVE